MNRRALLVAASVGLALQLAMVVAGHFAPDPLPAKRGSRLMSRTGLNAP